MIFKGKFRFCNRARPSAYVSVDTDTLFIEYCTGKVAGKGFTLTYATDQSEHFPTDPSSTSSSTSSAPDNTTESNVTAVTNTSSAGTTVTIATTTVKPPRPTRPPTGPVQCSMNPKSQDYCGKVPHMGDIIKSYLQDGMISPSNRPRRNHALV